MFYQQLIQGLDIYPYNYLTLLDILLAVHIPLPLLAVSILLQRLAGGGLYKGIFLVLVSFVVIIGV